MMMRRLLGLGLAAVLSSAPALGTAMPFTNAYFFGDSLSDTGNLFEATSTGLPFAPLPQAADYFDGRFSNGPVFSERLWDSLGLSGPLLPSFRGGTNYAVGGARAEHHAFDVIDDGDLSTAPIIIRPGNFPQFTLMGQLDLFKQNTGNGAAFDPGALYSVWHGANDVQDAFLLTASGDTVAAEQLLDEAADGIIELLGTLEAYGAEHLLVPNIPDLSRVPAIALGGDPAASALATQLTQSLNGAVDAYLATVPADVNVYRLDTFSFIGALVDDPAAFGFSEAALPCFTGFVAEPGATCPDSTGYVFWDRVHPTTEVHALIAQESLALVPVPAALPMLVSALALIGFVYRRQASAGAPAAGPDARRPA